MQYELIFDNDKINSRTTRIMEEIGNEMTQNFNQNLESNRMSAASRRECAIREREREAFISLHRYTRYRVAGGSNMAATTRPHKIHFKSEPIS